LKSGGLTLFRRQQGLAAMHEFIKKFVREGDGICLCTRFTRGTRYMGVDLAQMLDEQYRRTRPISIS
jgi:hypothetical protein